MDINKQSSALRPSGMRVLVVDDDEHWRRQLDRALSKAGYEVRLTASAPEGLAALRDFQADFIISDYCMPPSNGACLLDGVRTLRPDLVAAGRFAFVTGAPDVAGECIRPGECVVLLQKPCSLAEVVSLLATIVG